MKVNTKKILAISLPVLFATTTLAITAGTLVACSNNNDSIESNSTTNVLVTNTKLQELATSLSTNTNKYSMSQFNNFFMGENKQTNIYQVANKLGIQANAISSINASGNNPLDATVTISVAPNHKFVLNNEQVNSKNTITGTIENDGQSIVYSHVSFIPVIGITQAKINEFGALLDEGVNQITVSEFNTYFSGDQSTTNIGLLAKELGVDQAAIESVSASNNETDATVTITASSNYKFEIVNNFKASSLNGSIESEGKTIVYNHVSFVNLVNVSQSKINDVASNLNNNVKQLTVDSFNTYFEGEQASTNIGTLSNALGISDVNSIGSVIASGPNNAGTITISATPGYRFVQATKQSSSIGNVNTENNSIVFSNVTFTDLPTITSFVNSIDLNNQFITTTSNSQITTPSSTTTNATLTKNGLTVNIVANNISDNFVNISLPSSVNNVFDFNSLGINSNSTIQWSIQNGTSSNFSLNTKNGKQYIYNTSATNNNSVSTVTLTASIMYNGKKVANDVEVTFNFALKKIVDTSNIVLDALSLRNAFSCDPYAGTVTTNLDITTAQNVINLKLSKSITSLYSFIYCLGVRFDTLSNVLIDALIKYGLQSKDIGNNINWTATNPSENLVQGLYDSNIESTWSGDNNQNWSHIINIGTRYADGLFFTWNATIQNNSNDILLTSNTISFTVNIEIIK